MTVLHAPGVDSIGMSEFLAGVLAGGIAGAIAGSVITVVGTILLEHLRGRRENKTRFHQQKLQAYARYLGLIDLERQTQSRSHEEDLELRRSFTHAQAEVRVLASPAVRQAASEVFEAMVSEPGEGESQAAALTPKIERFIAAVKRELDIKEP